MSISEKLITRFAELHSAMNQLYSNNLGWYNATEWQKWATSSMNLIQAAFGSNSNHYKNFESAYSKCKGSGQDVGFMKGIFSAAKEDYESGYSFSVEAIISGEIYSDFIGLSKNALAEGSKDVAAVLACAALEDALKKYAYLNQLDVKEKVMQEVVNSLKSKGLVSGAQKSLLDTMPKIRDYAMHANWDKLTQQDVGSVIGFVEQFLLVHFS